MVQLPDNEEDFQLIFGNIVESKTNINILFNYFIDVLMFHPQYQYSNFRYNISAGTTVSGVQMIQSNIKTEKITDYSGYQYNILEFISKAFFPLSYTLYPIIVASVSEVGLVTLFINDNR